MIIESVRVQRFRSVRDQTLQCDRLTALLGPNGAGKSTFLRAISLFFSSDVRVGTDDWYGLATTEPIVISITFTNLPTLAIERFGRYLDDQKLTVSRVIRLDGDKSSARYHGEKLQHAGFQAVRTIAAARELTTAYSALRNQAYYAELPQVRSKDDALTQMDEWEERHPDQCEKMLDPGQFFGFSEVGQGYLGDFIRAVFVPAVRDASEDASEGRGSAITQLLDVAIRAQLANDTRFQAIKVQIGELYRTALEPQQEALQQVERQLTESLHAYAPASDVSLNWLEQTDFNIPSPKAGVRLTEDGYSSPVDRTGHGLQRAFILGILHHMATLKPVVAVDNTPADNQPPTPTPTLVLLIEEPELYQHPNRQRFLFRVLSSLADRHLDPVAEPIQVIYCTHSPLLISVDHFDRIRIVRKYPVPDTPGSRESRIVSTTLNDVAQMLQAAQETGDAPFTGETLRPRLASIMTPMVNEGFFADAVILVEGDGDKAAILGYASAIDIDLEKLGVAVIPCGGKPNLDRPYSIFTKLRIPCLIVWDNDSGGRDQDAEAKRNRILMRLIGRDAEDWPTQVDREMACLAGRLEEVLFLELDNAACEAALATIMSRFAFTKKKDALKCCTVVSELVKQRCEAGAESNTLDTIVNNAVNLTRQVNT